MFTPSRFCRSKISLFMSCAARVGGLVLRVLRLDRIHLRLDALHLQSDDFIIWKRVGSMARLMIRVRIRMAQPQLADMSSCTHRRITKSGLEMIPHIPKFTTGSSDPRRHSSESAPSQHVEHLRSGKDAHAIGGVRFPWQHPARVPDRYGSDRDFVILGQWNGVVQGYQIEMFRACRQERSRQSTGR